MSGKLIVIEGPDGGGKGTQIELLRETYPDLISFKYPTKTYTMLNDYLEKKASPDPKALFLLFLADIAEDQKNVRKALEKNAIVVLDRYIFSTIAYECDGIDYENGKRIVESVGYLKPDIVVLLDIDPRISQERKRKQKKLDRYEEDANYLGKVRKNFLKLNEERFLTPNWHRVDAGRDVRSVHSEILELLR